MARYAENTILGDVQSLLAQAFIYKVPEEFTLRTEEGEPVKDVAPVQKLTGHSRYLSSSYRDGPVAYGQKGKLATFSSIQPLRMSSRPHLGTIQ
jgi:hypothetical protein